jgi:hypothetical protein
MKSQPYHSVRTSKIHGRGVFASRPIRKGTKILEYTGPIVTADEADKIGADSENGHSHTMLFQIDKDRVIDGTRGGDARYINHSCDPNCEAVQYGDKIFIEALRAINKGEELVYDYHLQVAGKITDKVKKEYACFCGSPKCRGTQIAPEILKKQAKKDEKKRKEKEQKAALKEEKKKKKAEEKAAKKEEKQKRKAEEKAAKKEEKNKKKNKKKAKDTPSPLKVNPASPQKDEKKKKKIKKKDLKNDQLKAQPKVKKNKKAKK